MNKILISIYIATHTVPDILKVVASEIFIK